jgi:hypothetical protein
MATTAAATVAATTARAKVNVKSTLFRRRDGEDGQGAARILVKRSVGIEIARKIAFLPGCGRWGIEI